MSGILDYFRVHIWDILSAVYIPRIGIRDTLEILLITGVLYYIIRAIRNTRAWFMLKGTLVLFVAYIVAYVLQFDVIKTVFEKSVIIIAIMMIIVFQQDIKRLLEQLGTKNVSQYIQDFFKKDKGVQKRFSDDTLKEIVDSTMSMSAVKTGALMVFERNSPLYDITKTGIDIDAKISSALIINTFEKNTPLHDGAVVFRGDRMVSATCVLPLTSKTDISKSYGTRHRAGIGLSEETDSFVLIVSEETGHISVAEHGEIKRIKSKEDLEKVLRKLQDMNTGKQEKTFKNVLHNITQNISTILISIMIGLSVWIAGMTLLDPISTKTLNNIPVEIINENAILSNNKTYDLGAFKTVNIVVEGRRSELSTVTSGNIKATLDLSKISFENTADVNVQISNSMISVRDLSVKVVNVNIYDLSYVEFPIDKVVEGVPSDGYSLKNLELKSDSVTLTGADHIIKKVGKVEAKFNIDGCTNYENFISELVVYDKNGDIVPADKISLSINEIGARAILERTKSISINIKAVDTEDSAGRITKYNSDTTEIAVIGDVETINELESIDIEVPVKIEISDTSNKKMTKVIVINDYLGDLLPEGITLVDDTIKATLDIEYNPYSTKVFEVPTDNVRYTNGRDDLHYSLSEPTLSVTILGKDSILSLIKERDIELSCDVVNINRPGTYDCVIQANSSNGIIVNIGESKIVVEKKEIVTTT